MILSEEERILLHGKSQLRCVVDRALGRCNRNRVASGRSSGFSAAIALKTSSATFCEQKREEERQYRKGGILLELASHDSTSQKHEPGKRQPDCVKPGLPRSAGGSDG